MKRIVYDLYTKVNKGTEADPLPEEVFCGVKSIPYSEVNEEIAKKEAHNGEYTVEDDGQPEAVDEESAVYDEMAAAYSEGVQSA